MITSALAEEVNAPATETAIKKGENEFFHGWVWPGMLVIGLKEARLPTVIQTV